MAATYGRLTGKPGVCFSTLGPGATNLVTGAAYALLGGLPMLMITGQKPILQSRQARFQIIDTVGMMQPLTKMAKQIIDARNIPALVRDAFRIAQEERPGPVHLELPEDIAAQEVEPLRTGPGLGRSIIRSPRMRRSTRPPPRSPQAKHPLRDDRRRREPARPFGGAFAGRARSGHPVLQHADGQGRGRRQLRICSSARRRFPRTTTSIA